MKKRKSSMRARGSPRHERRPVGGHGGSVSLGAWAPPLQDSLRTGKQTGHPTGTC